MRGGRLEGYHLSHLIKTVSDGDYWDLLDQINRVYKPVIDGIGNLEANLADCMLELIRIAQNMYRIDVLPSDNPEFN